LYNEIQPSKLQPVDLYKAYNGKEKIVSSIKPKIIQSKIHNALPLMSFLSKQSYVKGVTAQVKAQSFYLGGSIQLNGLLIGINVQKENELYSLEDYIIEGTVLDLVQNENGVLLGAGVAKKLSFQVGDIIQVATKNNSIQSLKIVGLYQSGMADVDNVQSFVNLKMAQRLIGQSDDFITDINVKLNDMNQAPKLAAKMEEIFEVRAVDIQTANAQFETGSSIRTLISYAVSITLLIVAGFGIYNILNMLIYQKMNDIAILKATGFSGRDVKYIFISQAVIIGFIGGVLGLLLGFFVTRIIDNTPFNTAALPTIKTFPVVYDVKYYVIGMTFAMLSTFFAGYFPSRKAEKIDPVDIIRGQ
jgi:lipoprotein-releasing system permease protein